MKRTVLLITWSWTLAAGLLTLGCDEMRLRPVTKHYDLFFPEGSLQIDTFEQKAAAMIDILWAVDNSGSMQEEQDNLARNFDAFISIIEQSKVDYQIGVISSDMDLVDHQGKLLGNPRIIQVGPNARTQFAANVHVGTQGAGNERGLEASYHALTDPLISGYNAGFLREGAALAIIFVSDEDDHSFGKISFYQRVFEQMKNVGNENRVIAGAIVGDQPDGCQNPLTGSAAAGTRYHMLVQAVGGSIGSICASDFSLTLNQLGLTVAGLSRKFTLSDQEPEVNSMAVKVDGEEIPKDWQTGWTFENGSIFFNGSYVPPPGSSIEVSYLHPQREFILTQTPAYNPDSPGEDILVTVYPPAAPNCRRDADCPVGGKCGLAAKCGGQLIPYSFTDGWVLERRTVGNVEQYIVAFERNYYPEGGSTVQVVYQCAGGCKAS